MICQLLEVCFEMIAHDHHELKELEQKVYIRRQSLNCDFTKLNIHYEACSYKKKMYKKIKASIKSVQKEPTVKMCLLILDLKQFRSQVKRKHSIGREFQSLAVRRKKLLTDILVTTRNGDVKIMQFNIVSVYYEVYQNNDQASHWNQLSQFRRTSTKVIPIEKTYGGYISAISQGFRRGSK